MNNIDYNLIPGQLIKLTDRTNTRTARVFIHSTGSMFLLEAMVLDGGITNAAEADLPVIELYQGGEVVVDGVYFSMNLATSQGWHRVADGIHLKPNPHYRNTPEAKALIMAADRFFAAPKGTTWEQAKRERATLIHTNGDRQVIKRNADGSITSSTYGEKGNGPVAPPPP